MVMPEPCCSHILKHIDPSQMVDRDMMHTSFFTVDWFVIACAHANPERAVKCDRIEFVWIVPPLGVERTQQLMAAHFD